MAGRRTGRQDIGRLARWIAPAAVLVVAAVGYSTVFGETTAHPERLSGLVVEDPGVSSLEAKPAESHVEPASSSTWPTVKAAAKTDPQATAGYAREWKGAKDSSASAFALVELLPTTQQAEATRREIVARYTDAKELKKADTTISGRFTPTGIPDGTGIAYAATGSSSTSAGAVVIYDVGRTTVAVYASGGTATAMKEDAQTLAHHEHQLLLRREPSFSLTTARSGMASLLYWLVAVAAAALAAVTAYAVPAVLRRRRERRAAKREASLRREYRGRGSKVLRRRQSSFPQPSRRTRRPAGSRR